jgi:hypothetical protein
MQITDADTAKQYKHAIAKLEENRKYIWIFKRIYYIYIRWFWFY